ncbi:IS1182 family transposase, partial [Desulfallas thermosapovorans]|uniref:IS1182 family transposase n=1 Tax=Desulfallas thermosapovorans TaxID=58137 RepID=UPI0014122663
LDLTVIHKVYEKGIKGQPPYHPVLMTKILFYAYCRGVFSSRKIATHLYEDVAFIVLAGGNKPNFRTINEFRRRHIKSLPGIFVQILKLCEKAGLVGLKHVALDGTKINANASKHKAMSYDRMKNEEQKLEREIKKLLEKANHIDLKEDKQFGHDRRGDEIPEELAYRETRLAKIKEAKAALEAEAKLAQEEDNKKNNDKNDPPTPPRGKVKYVKKNGEPEPKAQRNFTDPESRIMKNSDKAFVQAYNSQAVVDSKSQIIVAVDVTNQAADSQHLPSMLEKVKENIGCYPKELSADAGYFSENNLKYLKGKTDAYIPGQRIKHNQELEPAPRGRIPVDLLLPDRMKRKLRTQKGRAKYALRKQTVEPVFGQIKEARGFRRFLLRGLDLVRGEWVLLCLTHNILKLFGNKKKLAW